MEKCLYEEYNEDKLIAKYNKIESIYRHCPLEYSEDGDLVAAKLYYSFYGRAKFVFNDNNDIYVLHDLQQLSRNVHSIKLESISDFEPYGNYISKLITHYKVTKYKMYIDYNKPIIPYSIPSSLKTLVLPFNFNQELLCNVTINNIPNTIPAFPAYGLTTLDMGIEFNKTIEANVLPKSLTSLTLSRHYNVPLLMESIPNSVTYLNMGRLYNHPLSPNGVIPNSINTLILSNEFNHPIEYGQLGEAITNLTFGNKFNFELPFGLLPTHLLKIKFGRDFNSTFAPSPFINKVKFGTSFIIKSDQSFPITLSTLDIQNTNHYQLPNIKKLIIRSNSNYDESPITQLPIDYYPYDTLISLNLDQLSKKQLETGFLANFRHLVHLKFGNDFNIPINKYCLPNKTLKSIEFGSHFDQALDLKRMKQLVYIKFGEFFTHLHDTIYPNSIKAITYNGFTNIKSNSLPSTIEYLELSNVSQTITNDILPKQLLFDSSI